MNDLCRECGGTGRTVGYGRCPSCAGYGQLVDGTRITVTGTDHKQVEEVLNSALRSAKRSRRYAVIAAAGALLAGTVAVLANLSQVLAFLGL